MNEIEEVLSSWIRQAAGGPGTLAPGVELARWIAERFVAWWRPQVERPMEDARLALKGIRSDAERLGGWNNPQLHGIMEEISHLGDALAELSQRLHVAND